MILTLRFVDPCLGLVRIWFYYRAMFLILLCIIFLRSYNVHLARFFDPFIPRWRRWNYALRQSASKTVTWMLSASPSLNDRLLTTLCCEELSLWINGQIAKAVPSCHPATESSTTLFFPSLWLTTPCRADEDTRRLLIQKPFIPLGRRRAAAWSWWWWDISHIPYSFKI